MLILLPPSEGKTAPAGGEPVELASLAFAGELDAKRRELLRALGRLGELPPAEAVAQLGVSERQAGEVARNLEIPTAPAAPAGDVYSGVLYDRLGLPSLSAAARERAGERLLIASGLWGLLRPADRIPYYRCSMKPKLEGIGPLARFWRPAVTAALEGAGRDREDGLVLDLRSGAYSAVWKPRRARLLAVRAFSERNGERKVVSHMAKAIRGEVARAVLEAPSFPDGAGQVAATLEAAGMTVELGERSLDVIVPT